jgi:MFS family permease
MVTVSGQPQASFSQKRELTPATIYIGLLFIAGSLCGGIYPVFVSSMMAAARVSVSQIGLLAGAEFIPFGLTIMFAGRFLPERRLRLIFGLSLVVHVLSTYMSMTVPFSALVVCRALSGGASGIMLWGAYAFIARSAHASRLVAIYSTVLMLLGVLWSWLIPNFVQPAFGPLGAILMLAVPSMLALLLLPFSPDVLAALPVETNEKGEDRSGIPLAAWLILCSWGIWMAYMGILWVYYEPLAERQMDGIVKNWLTISLICQVAGTASSAVLAERLPFRTVLSVGLIIYIAQMVALLHGVGSLSFVIWAGVYGFFGYFLIPYFLSALTASDPSRRSIVYFPAAQYVASSAAPLVVSAVVSDTDLHAGLIVSLVTIAIALPLFWAALAVFDRRKVALVAT